MSMYSGHLFTDSFMVFSVNVACFSVEIRKWILPLWKERGMHLIY